MELTNEFEVPVPVEEAWKVLTDLEVVAPCLPGAQLQEVEGEEYRGTVTVRVGPISAIYEGAASFTELDAVSHRAVLSVGGRETRGQGNANATVTATLAEEGGSTKVTVVTDLNITGKVAQFGRGVLGEVSTKMLDQFADNLQKTVLAPASEGDPTGGAAPVPPATEPAKPARAPRKRKPPASTAPDEASAASAEAGEPAAAAPPATEAASEDEAAVRAPAKSQGDAGAIRKIEGPKAEPVNLMQAAAPSLAKRIVPYASVAGGIFLLRIVFYAFKRRKK